MGKGTYREKQAPLGDILNIRPDEWLKSKRVKYHNNYDKVDILRLPRRFTDLYRNQYLTIREKLSDIDKFNQVVKDRLAR